MTVASPTMRVAVDGGVVSRRVLLLVNEAYRRAGILQSKRWITQGSYNPGGVSASGGTHAGGGAVDLRTRYLSAAEIDRLVFELRVLCGGPVWYRAPEHGWTKTGPHIHAIVRDEPGLSPSAAWQVAEYDAGRNGLSGGSTGPDYHPRPKWQPFVISSFARVTRFPRTGVYVRPDRYSKRVAWKGFSLRPNVEYVAVVRDSNGRPWLQTRAGYFIDGRATNARV